MDSSHSHSPHQSPSHPSPRRKANPPTSISSDFENHWIGSHTKIHRKESNKVVDDKPLIDKPLIDKPLIDLSDETDTSTTDTNKPTTPSEISSLFDSLLTNTSHYGNLELAKPLIRDSGSAPDPFEVNVTYSKPPARPQEMPGQSKAKATPPSRPKPIVYRRTTSVESQHSNESSQSFSPPKTGSPHKSSSTRSLPADMSKKKKHSHEKVSVAGVTTKDSDISSSSFSSPKKTPIVHVLADSSVSVGEDKSKLTKALLEEIFSKTKQSAQFNSRNQSALVSPVHQPIMSHNKQRQDKAFDWLNDALSNFTLTKAGKSGSDPAISSNTFPKYDEVPREETAAASPRVRPKVYKPITSKQKLPEYSQVPNESLVSQTQVDNTQKQYPRYDEVPKFEDPKDVKLPVPRDIYVPQSTVSYDDWDDLDSDFDDDDDDDDVETTAQGAGVLEQTSPPPLPPRDYNKDEKLGKPHIRPICQDGRQLSHTHYFLIPPKGEKHHPSERNMAEVRPFSIDGSQLSPRAQKSSALADYQNLTVKPREDCVDPHKNSHSAEDLVLSVKGQRGHNWPERRDVDVSQSYPHAAHHRAGYQRSQSHSPRSQGMHGGYPQEKITQLQKKVIGVTDEECHAALCHCNWDIDRSVKHLKTEQLFRLGLATREDCWKLLEALKWNLELASSVMLDQYRSSHGISMESAV